MCTQSKDFQKLEEKVPTPLDLHEIERKATSLGRGDLIHDVSNHLSVLNMVMSMAAEKGWSEQFLSIWHRSAGKINAIITRANIDKAREKGLM